MFAAAFQDDPVMAFIFPDPEVRRARLPHLLAVLHDGDKADGAAYVTDGLEAATLWRVPGRGRLSWRERLLGAVPMLAATRSALGRVLAVGRAIDAHHPAEPYWYLHLAGCMPGAQGRGFGGAAIRAGLRRADADGVPAYLETGREGNLAVYRALGFGMTGAWRVPDGPPKWSMLRPAPRGGRNRAHDPGRGDAA